MIQMFYAGSLVQCQGLQLNDNSTNFVKLFKTKKKKIDIVNYLSKSII